MKKRIALTLSTVVLSLAAAGCAEVYAQGVARKVANDLDKIESYRGQVTERGALEGGDDLVSTVVYARPFRLRVEVTAPEKHAGELFLYDGKRMVMWFPQALFGIEVVGVTNPSKKEVFAHIKRQTREAMRAYAFSLRSENRKVAGERTKQWKIVPTRRHPYRIAHTSWNHSSYSMPLKMEMKDRAGEPWYSMEFDKIEFNTPIADSELAFEFPENAVVFRWDLSAEGITLAEARKKMNFDVRMPASLPDGHEVGKIIKSPHCLPALVIMMNNDASWLSLTESRHIEGIYEPRGKRVAIDSKTVGHLSFLGPFTSLTWVVGNTQMTLTGNISFPSLIDVAASVK